MKACPECNGEISLNEKYDAEFCEKCNVWLEKKCDWARCPYCPKRPEKPNE